MDESAEINIRNLEMDIAIQSIELENRLRAQNMLLEHANAQVKDLEKKLAESKKSNAFLVTELSNVHKSYECLEESEKLSVKRANVFVEDLMRLWTEVAQRDDQIRELDRVFHEVEHENEELKARIHLQESVISFHTAAYRRTDQEEIKEVRGNSAFSETPTAFGQFSHMKTDAKSCLAWGLAKDGVSRAKNKGCKTLFGRS